MAIYAGCVGFRLAFTVNIDISPPGLFQVEMVRPDGTSSTLSPTLDSGPAGTCHYDVTATDLTMAGLYRFRPKFYPTGSGNLRLGPAVTLGVDSVG